MLRRQRARQRYLPGEDPRQPRFSFFQTAEKWDAKLGGGGGTRRGRRRSLGSPGPVSLLESPVAALPPAQRAPQGCDGPAAGVQSFPVLGIVLVPREPLISSWLGSWEGTGSPRSCWRSLGSAAGWVQGGTRAPGPGGSRGDLAGQQFPSSEGRGSLGTHLGAFIHQPQTAQRPAGQRERGGHPLLVPRRRPRAALGPAAAAGSRGEAGPGRERREWEPGNGNREHRELRNTHGELPKASGRAEQCYLEIPAFAGIVTKHLFQQE